MIWLRLRRAYFISTNLENVMLLCEIYYFNLVQKWKIKRVIQINPYISEHIRIKTNISYLMIFYLVHIGRELYFGFVSCMIYILDKNYFDVYNAFYEFLFLVKVAGFGFYNFEFRKFKSLTS